MSRLLCFDIGKKKVGIAISDKTKTVARALKKIHFNQLRKELQSLLTENTDIEGLVIGLPQSKSGEAAIIIKQIAENLKAEFHIPVYFQDERLTSWEARENLKEAGYTPEQIKEKEDETAAQIILQSFLESMKYLKES